MSVVGGGGGVIRSLGPISRGQTGRFPGPMSRGQEGRSPGPMSRGDPTM